MAGSCRRVDGSGPSASAASRRWPTSAAALTQVHGRVVWSGLAGHDAIAGTVGPGSAGGPDGPLGPEMLLVAPGSATAAHLLPDV